MAESHSTGGQSGDDAEARRRRAAELLSQADLFSGVDRGTPAKPAAKHDPLPFVKDGAACRQGEVGDSLYLVSEGAFGVFISSEHDARQVRVATLGRGACFGGVAFLTRS